jgi:hypothetical protein
VEALAIFLMSASIAATAESTAARAAMRPLHGGKQPGYSLAGPQRLFDEGGAEGPWQADTEYHGESTDLVLQHDPLAGQLLARDAQCANGMRRQRLHVHRLEEAAAGQMGEATRIIASVLWVANDFSA